MRTTWRREAAAASLVLAAACSAEVDGPSPLPAWPDTIAAIGDSITTAALPDRDHLSADNPELSWVTGGTDVGSHRARIAEQAPEVTAVNVAVAGARIADAPAQAERAVATGADYVTFLLGANDVCAAACAAHHGCRYDDGAVAAYRFRASEVSPADFFHPSIAGQRRLAELTWEVAFGG